MRSTLNQKNDHMKIIVFAAATSRDDETAIVTKMFDEGLECFHFRKPMYNLEQAKQYINAIPRKYRNRIIVHSYHRLAINYGLMGIHLTRIDRKNKFLMRMKLLLFKAIRPDLVVSRSYHSLSKLTGGSSSRFDHVFLSPVFNSVSKTNNKSSFNESKMKEKLAKTGKQVMALGGVEIDK
ncbi:MAG: thiamine phosphate synthase, partial [Bacteroidetes bacterium]|nr:thiamine phosphate synthase [Bacteroidota bacterium]